MAQSFKLPSARPAPAPTTIEDARFQLERLYREIGISAVASALHMNRLATPEDREAALRASHEIPPMLRKENAA
jgi:hypothetical protein